MLDQRIKNQVSFIPVVLRSNPWSLYQSVCANILGCILDKFIDHFIYISRRLEKTDFCCFGSANSQPGSKSETERQPATQPPDHCTKRPASTTLENPSKHFRKTSNPLEPGLAPIESCLETPNSTCSVLTSPSDYSTNSHERSLAPFKGCLKSPDSTQLAFTPPPESSTSPSTTAPLNTPRCLGVDVGLSEGPGPPPSHMLPELPFTTRDIDVSSPPQYNHKEQQTMTAAADMMVALGQSESACFFYLLLYKSKGNWGKLLPNSLSALLALSRSVTNYQHADIVGQLLCERVDELTKVRSCLDSTTNVLAYSASRPTTIEEEGPILLALVVTIKLRALANILAATEFTERKAKMWDTQVENAMEQLSCPSEFLRRTDFELKDCTHYVAPRNRRANTETPPLTISYASLAQLISKFEQKAELHHRNNTFGEIPPSTFSSSHFRLRALRIALEACTIPSAASIFAETVQWFGHGGITYQQATYMSLYSVIWDDLCNAVTEFAGSMAEIWKSYTFSTGQLAGHIVTKITKGSTLVPYSCSLITMDREWEIWVGDLQHNLKHLVKYPDDVLDLWLGKATRTPSSGLAISQRIVFKFVAQKTGLDVLKIASKLQHNSDGTADKVPSAADNGFSSESHTLLDPSIESGDTSTTPRQHRESFECPEIVPRTESPSHAPWDQLNGLYLLESHSRRTSVLSTTSSFQRFKKLLPQSYRYSAASQEMQPPSTVIRRSQRSDWSLVWDSMSALSHRFSKASISTKNSRFSKYVLWQHGIIFSGR